MKFKTFWALLLTLSLVAAACSDDTDPVEGAADDTPSTTADDAPATTTAVTTPTSTTSTTVAEKSEVTEARIGLQLEPPTLDLTASPAAAIPQVLLYNVYETLVRLQADGSITGLLAESWEVSDDALTYTFSLRDGVSFHNGDPLTAEDVVFSIENVLREEEVENDEGELVVQTVHPFASTFAPIDTVIAVDDSTVEITLTQPSANLLFFMTQGQGVILNQNAIDDIANNAIGTGPFEFEEWTVGDNIVISANPDYWGEPALLETIDFQYIADPNALNNAMLSDQLDLVAGVSAPELLEVFEADERFEVLTGLTYGEVTLSLNGRRAPFDDVLVRQAVSHAIDRQAVVDLAYAGYGTPIGSFSTPLDPWFKDLTGVYPYDPARAEELLTEAGATGATIEMVLPPPSYASRGGEIIASQLEQVGLDVNITNVEWGVWLEDVFSNNDFDMSIVAHVEPLDLAQYGNPDYYWGNDSPDVAPILAQADAEADPDVRNELYGQVLDEITAQAADQWLFVIPQLSVLREGTTGYKVDLPGSLDVTQMAINPR
ncbi:MAG: ABC transporter substrate-binding protein [Acidimicrobiia bacterium]|nr:ABC transporter substrate-binding protein [Acidimicrobiia bacterium]